MMDGRKREKDEEGMGGRKVPRQLILVVPPVCTV